MIPKVIHYCWFGRNPLPESAKRCIESWRRFFPDYEIIEWNEDSFDLNMMDYVKEAYQAKKYAFVSDVARFWVLFNFGGVYFDTDVEVLKPFDPILQHGSFMGFEDSRALGSDNNWKVNPGLGIAAPAGMSFYSEILTYYSEEHFINSDSSYNYKTVVTRVTDLLVRHGLKNINEFQTVESICIYPCDFFCPISIVDGVLRITENTYSIHHFAASWVSPIHRIARKIVLKIGGARLKKILCEIIKKNE